MSDKNNSSASRNHKNAKNNNNNNDLILHDADVIIHEKDSRSKSSRGKKRQSDDQDYKPNYNSSSKNSNNNRSNNIVPKAQYQYRPKSAPRDKDFDAFAREFTKDYGEKASQEDVDSLRKELQAFKSRMSSMKELPPLAQIGSGISGPTARVMQSLVNPLAAPATPLPGQKPGSVIQCDQVFETSVNLENGGGSVIGTPFGRYQCYISTNKSPAGTDQIEVHYATDGWDYPHFSAVAYDTGVVTQVHQIDGKSGTVNAGTGWFKVFGDSVNKPDDYFTITSSNDAGSYSESALGIVNRSSTCVLRYWITDDLGVDETSGALNVATDSSVGIKFLNDVRRNYDATVNLLNPGVGATVTKRVYLVIDKPVEGQAGTHYFNVNVHVYPAQYQTEFGTFVMPLKYKPKVPDITYAAHTFSALTGLAAGGQIKDGKFMSQMLLISDDAGTLNNSGNIVATTFDKSAWASTGQDPIQHASAALMWKYIDRLRDGSYQIYVPDLQEMATVDLITSNPWTTRQSYCMTNYFDYMGVDGQAPVKLALRIRMAGSFLTPQLLEFVRPTSYPEDSSFRLCLSLLRTHYNPCCNPDHLKEISKWLTNVFHGASQHAKSFLKGSATELVKRLPSIVEAAAPLVVAGLAAL